MEILEQLALLFGKLFWQVINLTITGSIAIQTILIFRQALQRSPKRFSFAFWSVAAFRLLCPVSLSSAISLFRLSEHPFSWQTERSTRLEMVLAGSV